MAELQVDQITRAVTVEYISGFTNQDEREQLVWLASKVRSSNFKTFKVEALSDDGDFLWIDDTRTEYEIGWLRERGWLDRWLFINIREHKTDCSP